VADAPKPPTGSESPSGPRRATTGERRTITAERAAVLPPEPPKKVTADALKATALETVLNSAGILRDLAGDFQRQDSFFKYKALVILSWLALSTTSIVVGCPGGGVSNDISARLVVAGDAARPVYMVKNDSSDKWTDVEVTVNGRWRTTAGEVESHGDLTLVPRLLINPEGESASGDLRVTEIDVRTAEGEAALMRGGRPLH
jgi:hypothetical protein